LTKAEIEDLKRRYVWAAEVLAKAGADGIIVCLTFFNGIAKKS
jgi:2,4-dienoyl-CoA reductase-like NADH-dependent reductase (Old Yellow Enzyme family)